MFLLILTYLETLSPNLCGPRSLIYLDFSLIWKDLVEKLRVLSTGRASKRKKREISFTFFDFEKKIIIFFILDPYLDAIRRGFPSFLRNISRISSPYSCLAIKTHTLWDGNRKHCLLRSFSSCRRDLGRYLYCRVPSNLFIANEKKLKGNFLEK